MNSSHQMFFCSLTLLFSHNFKQFLQCMTKKNANAYSLNITILQKWRTTTILLDLIQVIIKSGIYVPMYIPPYSLTAKESSHHLFFIESHGIFSSHIFIYVLQENPLHDEKELLLIPDIATLTSKLWCKIVSPGLDVGQGGVK